MLQTVAASSWAAVRAGAASSSSSIFMAGGRWWLNDGGVGGVGWREVCFSSALGAMGFAGSRKLRNAHANDHLSR